MSGAQHQPKPLTSPTKPPQQRGGGSNNSVSGMWSNRPTTAPARPLVERAATFARRASHSKASQAPTELRRHSDNGALHGQPPTPLTTSELEAVRAVWDELVVAQYRTTIETVDALLALFQALHIRLLPDVEAYAIKAFTSSAYNSLLEYDQFSELVMLCKHQHELCLKRNPLLMDDLVDAFVALGGQWDTKGSLDNEKMRKMIKQYGIRVDFDKFLEVVDTDGNAMVDFDEFKKLVEDVEAFSNRPFYGDGALELAGSNEFSLRSPRRRGVFMQGGPLSAEDLSTAGVGADDLSNDDSSSGGYHHQSKVHQSTNPLGASYSAVPLEPVASVPSASSAQHHTTSNNAPASVPATNKANPPSLPSSPTRTSFLVSASGIDPLASLAKRVAAVTSRQTAPSAHSEPGTVTPMAVSSFYRQVGLAVTNTCDLESFRERCAPLMKVTARTGNQGAFAAVRTQNTVNEGRQEAVDGCSNHLGEKRVEAFLNRMSMNPECKQGLLAERKLNLQQKRIDEERQKKLRKRRADAKEKATAHCSISHFHDTATASSPVRRTNSQGSMRDGSRRPSFASPIGQRRRSGAAVSGGGLDAPEDLPISDEEDDGMNSVYSTSSSQRSDDDKRHNFNFFHLGRSGKTTPTLPADAPQNEDGNPAVALEGAIGASVRRRSLQGNSAPGAPQGSNKAVNNAVKMKLRDKLLLSSTPTVRLTGNSNQVRCDKVRPNPEEDEAAKARARVPQVPASKLTPRMRAHVAGLTIGEKKENCRVDENGQQRNELNAKLYACYHGRF